MSASTQTYIRIACPHCGTIWEQRPEATHVPIVPDVDGVVHGEGRAYLCGPCECLLADAEAEASAPLQTRHFNVYTGYADVADKYRLCAALAEVWAEVGIQAVRIFNAGVVNCYLSITARVWYTPAHADDPDWRGDAEDCIARIKGYQHHYKALRRKPHPERHWQGSWREFSSAEALREYAAQAQARLAAR